MTPDGAPVSTREPPRLAISLGPTPLDATGTVASRLSAVVRAAVGRGILMFDLTEAPEPLRCWDLVAAAAGPPWVDAMAFVTATSPSGSDSVGVARPDRIVRFVEGSDFLRAPPSGSITGSGVRFRDISLAEAGSERCVRAGASWVSFPGHLLEARRTHAVVEVVRTAGAQALVTNPHADGRLDGRWLAEGSLANDGPPRPLGLAELQRAYAPLLPLGFLTAGHRRTLPQAAVGFVQALGAVPSVRVRDLRQFEEFANPASFPSLAAEEMTRIFESEPGLRGAASPATPPGFK
ncbi:MAG: hypothetical protein L3K00_00685 [Thermoplasmata archaeon]|nr:hypothetical protein [Thermoplasmata archaeon]